MTLLHGPVMDAPGALDLAEAEPRCSSGSGLGR